MKQRMLRFFTFGIVFIACAGRSDAGLGVAKLYQLLGDECFSSCSCNWQGGDSSCAVNMDCSGTPNTCAQCVCTNKGCSSSCASKQGEGQPANLPLTGKPITDFTVEDFTLGHFRDLIESSGWDTSGFVSGTTVPYSKTYSGAYDFEDLLEAVAADLGICYEINEQDLDIAFEDCE